MNYKLAELENLIKTVKPDGVSLDFIRFFVFWEKVLKNDAENLKQTCFDDRCVSRFEKETGITIPHTANSVTEKANWILNEEKASWADWKCLVIKQAVNQLTRKIRKTDPMIKIGLHSVPWLSETYNGAVKAIAGQNLSYLTPYVDFFTPMCYSHMLDETPQWIDNIVKEQTLIGGKTVVPSIHVEQCYRDETFPVARFEEAVRIGLQEPSKGIVFWSWADLDRSEEKKALIKKRI